VLVSAAFGSPALTPQLEQIEAEAADLCPAMAPHRPLSQVIDELSGQLHAAVGASADGATRVRTLNDFVFKTLAIKPSRDLHDLCNLLPSAVLERRQGYCVGIAALYLALAERLDLPIHAVATPSHVFLRYDDGTRQINIETFSVGASIPDDQYIYEQKIAPSSIEKGVFLRDLSADGFLSQVHNNLGVVYSERQQFDAAEREYRRALDLNPLIAASWYNWGNDLLQSGQYPKAIRAFTRSLKLHPNDAWALTNRGVAYLKLRKTEKARRDFETALSLDAAFAPARQGLQAFASHQ
jgi:regulator of sirC expression with transglutaminase-like and TPR domain